MGDNMKGRKWILVTLTVIWSLSVQGETTSITSPDGIDIAAVQEAIEATGARWSAAESRVSRLSREQRIARLGLRSGRGVTAASGSDPAEVFTFDSRRALPSSFDWRERAVVTPVKDQGQCGSCWAFSIIGAFESAAIIQAERQSNWAPLSRRAYRPGDESEQYLVSFDTGNAGCDGGEMRIAAEFLKSRGSISETCLPYRADDMALAACHRENRELLRLLRWSKVPQDLDLLKAAVYRGPVAVGFLVYEDFFSYESGIYSHTGSPDETPAGGHGVLVVGWNDDEEYFIVKNSWDTDWGEEGYFRIAYSQMWNGVEFGGLEASVLPIGPVH
jgi:C1A family cysteine protease